MPLIPLIDLNWLNERTSSLDFIASIFCHFLLQSVLEDTWSYLNTLPFHSHFHPLINYLVSANTERMCPISHEKMAWLAASQLLTTQLSCSKGLQHTDTSKTWHIPPDQEHISFLLESLPPLSVALHRRPLQFIYSFPLKDLWALFNKVSIYSCLIESFVCVLIFCLNLVSIKMFFLWNLLRVSRCNSHSLENLQSAYMKGRVVEKTPRIWIMWKLQLHYSS